MKTALVLGAGGFIGGHLVNRLMNEDYWVRGVDIKTHEYVKSTIGAVYFMKSQFHKQAMDSVMQSGSEIHR